MHIVSTGLCYIGIHFIHNFMYEKQWNEVFLYPGVSKAISRTTPWNIGFCYINFVESTPSYNMGEKQLRC